MKTLFSFLSALLLVFTTEVSYGQQLVWKQILGGDSKDLGSSAIETPDGGFLLIGTTASYLTTPTTSENCLVVKTDGSGNVLWQKAVGTSHVTDGVGITANVDGSYTLYGYADLPTVSDPVSFWMATMDAQGMISNEQLADTTIGKFLEDAIALDDRTFLATAFLNNQASRVQRIARDGTVLWSKKYAGRPQRLLEMKDGNLALAGITPYNTSGFVDIGIHVVSKNGDSLWDLVIPSTRSNTSVNGVAETPDGGLLLVGSRIPDYNGYEMYLTKINVTHQVSWTKTDSSWTSKYPQDMMRTANNTYLIVGSTSSDSSGTTYVGMVNDTGKILWGRPLSTISDSIYTSSIRVMQSGHDFIIAGSRVFTSIPTWDAVLMKVSDGVSDVKPSQQPLPTEMNLSRREGE